MVGYFAAIFGGVAVLFFVVSWLWNTVIAPLGLAWYWITAITFIAVIGVYAYGIWGMARNQFAHRVTDVRQKVRDDLQFLAIYTAIVTPIVLIVAFWNDALADLPKFFAGVLLLGLVAKLKGVLRPSAFRE
jgi:hypothetical protein